MNEIKVSTTPLNIMSEAVPYCIHSFELVVIGLKFIKIGHVAIYPCIMTSLSTNYIVAILHEATQSELREFGSAHEYYSEVFLIHYKKLLFGEFKQYVTV